jgi:very-short-patch-repair endonuclease
MLGVMSDLTVIDALTRLGGVATRQELVSLVSPRALRAALSAGDRVARGRYALPQVEAAARAAHRLRGTLCLLSAAQAWGWGVRMSPAEPQVAVPKHRRMPARARRGVELHFIDLGRDEISEGRTSRDRTLMDCLRALPFADALAVADSALRSGYRRERLRALARDARGPGSAQIRRVAELADVRAANPFESVLRAIALEVTGLQVTPQVSIREPEFLGRSDLVDVRLRIILEADSFEWHGGRAALASDAQRYDTFVAHGWLVLRFAWEQVMFEGEWVKQMLEMVVKERTDQLCPACRPA